MKRFVFGALALIIIAGCNSKGKSTQDNRNNETISQQNEILEKQRKDSLSLYVWDSVKFGMTKEEVRKTGVFGKLNTDSRWVTLDFNETSDFANNYDLRELWNVKLTFGDLYKKLNNIHFESTSFVYANHIDDMLNDCLKIVSIIEQGIHGQLEWEKKDVSIFDFNEGEKFKLMDCHYGKFWITIEMGESYSGSEYYYKVDVYCSDFSD